MIERTTTRNPEFRKKNLQLWEQTLHEIFPTGIPSSAIWSKRDEIIRILNKIGHPYINEFGTEGHMNHTFFPGGGGFDLCGAELSVEPDCIELTWSEKLVSIVKPDILTFESFGDQLEWAYFRLDCLSLKPTDVYETSDRICEELTDLGDAYYVERSASDEGFYGYDESGREIPLPNDARVVTRYFSGTFVIFAKGSIYNAISATYDGRHNTMTRDRFRIYIKEAANQYSETE